MSKGLVLLLKFRTRMGTQSPSKMGIIFKVMVQGYVFTTVHWETTFQVSAKFKRHYQFKQMKRLSSMWQVLRGGVGTKIYIGLEDNQIKGIHA